MASDGSPSRDSQKKKKKSTRKGKSEDVEDSEVQVGIESLTASGHKALRQGDCAQSLDYFKKAFKVAVKLKEAKVLRACAFNLGAAYVEAGKPQKGLDFLSRAEPGERGERVADLQFNLASAHEALENHTQAARHYLQAAQLYRSQGDGSSEGDTCIRLAHCHLRRKEWAEAAESYLRAADSYKVAGKPASSAVALKDAGNHMLQCDCFTADDVISVLTECLELSANITENETLGKLYNAVGLSFSQLKLFPEASECYQLALPLVCSSPRRLAVVLQNLGAIHNTLAQYQRALEYHREAAALHGSLGSRQAQGRCFCNLGYALSELGKLEEAGENYLHAQQAFKDSDDSSGQWQACEGLAGIRMRKRDPEKAIFYYKEALSLLSKCKDVSSSVQERLVNKLSEALQLKLAMQQRGPPARRAVQERHLDRQQLRMADRRAVEATQGDRWRRELPNSHRADKSTQDGRTTEPYGHRKDPSDMVVSSRVAHTEQPEYLKALPEANRNLNNTYEKPEVQIPVDSHVIPKKDEPPCGSSKQKQGEPSSEAPLLESTDISPSAQLDSEEATPLHRRLKSSFCIVM